MNYFNIVLNQVFLFIIYAAAGVIAVKTKLVTEDGLASLSRLILRICIPVMLFANTINGATRADFIDNLPVMLLTVLMYVITYLTGRVLGAVFHMKGNTGRVYRACTMFGNIGFIGIPITAALFPERGMLYIALFTVVDQLILWTIGWDLCAPEGNDNGLSFVQIAMKLISPSVIAILLAVFFVFTGLQIPEVLNTGLTKIGGITSVLAMIYLGGSFCFIDIRSYVRRIEIYVEILVKMLIVPVLFSLLLDVIPGITEEVRATMVVLIALPTMSTIPIFAAVQHSEEKYATAMLFVNTLASLVTMPIICLWLGR